jgi:hypothetical protein
MHSATDNAFILPASLKKFKLCKIKEYFNLEAIPNTVETIELEFQRKDIHINKEKVIENYNLA